MQHIHQKIKKDGAILETDTDEIKYRKYKAYLNWPGIYFRSNR